MAPTKVEFHTGVADKLDHACRLLRKAHTGGARLVVSGDHAALDRLDVALWTFDALSFVPHVRLQSGAQPSAAQARTPVWLADEPASAPQAPVLVNLGPCLAADWQRFERVIEIVAADPADSAQGRQRWREYAGHGDVELSNHAVGRAS